MTSPSRILISGDLDLEVSIGGLLVWRGRSYRQARLIAETWQIECDDVPVVDLVSPLADLSVAHDNHGEAAEEQHKTSGRKADETSRNAVEATHDTSFRPKDDAAGKLIKTFGIRERDSLQ